MTSFHNGRRFTTRNNDNDNDPGNCAKIFDGAWWFNSCFHSHFNAPYQHNPGSMYGRGIIWIGWRGFEYSLKFTEMKTGCNDN